jgi:phosphoglycerate dehydrogenase-like enzyme
MNLLREKGVMLCNARGVNAIVVAEHAIALMFALAKRLTVQDAAVKRTDWVEWSPLTSSVMLAGATVAVVGLGLIGNEIAKRCKAFDMKVIGVRRRPTDGRGAADVVQGIEQLHEVLAVSDVVILVVPLTAETRGLIGYAELAKMKASAFLINVARGMIVKEAALHEALVTNKIAGFAADVWWDYSEASPAGYHYDVPSRRHIHRLPNVVGTPDVAANVPGMRDRMIEMGVENIKSFLSGNVPERAIDLNAGY